MADFNVPIDQLDRYLSKAGKDAVAKVDTALYRAASRGRKLLIERTPRGVSAQMRNAWTEPKEILNGYEVRNDAPHALIVELGSRPHMPPVEPIYLWVKRVLGGQMKAELSVALALSGQRSVKGGKGALVDKQARALAWAIALSIKKKGTRAQHVAGGAEPELKRFVEEELERVFNEG